MYPFRNLRYFFSGSLIAMVCLTTFLLLVTESIAINDGVSWLPQVNILFIAWCTAFFEEIIFRFYLFTFLKNKMHPGWALLISSAAFATCHLGNSHVSAMAVTSHFLGGLIYGIAYLRTNNIFYPIGLHFGWNVTQHLFSLPMSGRLKSSVFNIQLPESVLLYGGQYGLEGGILSLAVRGCILAIVLTSPLLRSPDVRYN